MNLIISNSNLASSRPRTVEDVASQEEVVAVLRRTLQGADVSILSFSMNYA
jgi:hypothetical protein